ncbi:hypothetical protein Tco_0768286, partial [Tanacetum coccineum]
MDQQVVSEPSAQTRFESVSKYSNDPLLARVLDLEKTKTFQVNEIASLKRKVKKLENKDRSRTHKLKMLYKVALTAMVESSEESLGEDASKQGRKINDIDDDEDITLVSHDDEMFDVDVLNDEETNVAEQDLVEEVATTTTATDNVDEVTLAQTLMEIKSAKPKVKGIVIQDTSTITTITISSQQSQDKGKGIMIELERPMKKKDQISFD